jgi:hypothetical protein
MRRGRAISSLAALNNLEDAQVERIRFRRYQTEVVIDLLIVVDDEGELLPRIRWRSYRMSFGGVQRVVIENALNSSQIEDPAAMNWGMNLVADVTIIDDDVTSPASLSFGLPFVTPFASEAGADEPRRHIDIESYDLTIEVQGVKVV